MFICYLLVENLSEFSLLTIFIDTVFNKTQQRVFII